MNQLNELTDDIENMGRVSKIGVRELSDQGRVAVLRVSPAEVEDPQILIW